ncbi:hypothetical protein K493DRAFT_338831 [Basidiobolus meristosporus CBS 931.73]|uniref:Lysozyme-like protein n=1 Tax=Basidiobolus meristosporus CBS 931.73 TaxID=1314790 RepID=A0A1Y1Y338_9FUNG|nr:hypothetical protein K493DRAFT_338831 [Basidiobolus meristosporus CBS 931.73]|eukprot:ORX92410.1 hypothetical protein K493DRAFT_338831 [Basidiobolus meristosporus CBS 931.73]
MRYTLFLSCLSLLTAFNLTNAYDARLTLEILEAAVPSSAGQGQCPQATFKEECRNAQQALAPLRESFIKYGIDSVGAEAAIIALIAYESGSFAFNINHWPGRAGQGTRNMMMFPGIHEYVKSLASVNRRYLKVIANLSEPFSEEKQNEIRALVLDDRESFASAAWYLTKSSECPRDTLEKLRANTEDAFKYYTLSCVKTDGSTLPDRIAIWKRVTDAYKAHDNEI